MSHVINKNLYDLNQINFAVIIRSIGERTEQLCYDACSNIISKKRIHIIKNYFPSYKTFDKMFQIVIKNNYHWYLALDSDLILKPGWPYNVIEVLSNQNYHDYYAFSFAVKDKFFGRIDRGNHFFNGKYAVESRRILNKKTKYFPKPETSIKLFLKGEIKRKHFSTKCIGFHGFEQYRKHIYYRFWNRRRRGLSDYYKNIFLSDCYKLKDINYDYKAALLGWEGFNKKERFKQKILPRTGAKKIKFFNKIDLNLLNNNIPEKSKLILSYKDFIDKNYKFSS